MSLTLSINLILHTVQGSMDNNHKLMIFSFNYTLQFILRRPRIVFMNFSNVSGHKSSHENVSFTLLQKIILIKYSTVPHPHPIQ